MFVPCAVRVYYYQYISNNIILHNNVIISEKKHRRRHANPRGALAGHARIIIIMVIRLNE